MQRPGSAVRPLRGGRAQGAGCRRQDGRVHHPPHGLHVAGHVRCAVRADSRRPMRVPRPVIRVDRIPVRRRFTVPDAPQPYRLR